MLCDAGAAKPKCDTEKREVPRYLPTDLPSRSVVHAGRWVGDWGGQAQGTRQKALRHKADGWVGWEGEGRGASPHCPPASPSLSVLHDVDRRSTQSLIAP